MPRCWRSRTSRPTLTTGESRPPGPSVRSGETQLHACKQDASIHHSSKLSFSGHEMLLSVIPRETVPAARPAASLPPASMARQPAGMAGVSGSVAKTHVIGDVGLFFFFHRTPPLGLLGCCVCEEQTSLKHLPHPPRVPEAWVSLIKHLTCHLTFAS